MGCSERQGGCEGWGEVDVDTGALGMLDKDCAKVYRAEIEAIQK